MCVGLASIRHVGRKVFGKQLYPRSVLPLPITGWLSFSPHSRTLNVSAPESVECTGFRDCETQGTAQSPSLILNTEGLNDHVYRLLRTTLHTSGPLHPLSSQNSGSQTFISHAGDRLLWGIKPKKKNPETLTLGFPNKEPTYFSPIHRPELQLAFKSLILTTSSQRRFAMHLSKSSSVENRNQNNHKTREIDYAYAFLFLKRET